MQYPFSAPTRIGIKRLSATLCFGAAAICGPALAQQDALGPPPALEFPYEASPDAKLGRSIQFFRAFVEQAADLELCKILMRNDGQEIPLDAEGKGFCPSDYQQKVANGEGAVHWADGARPLQCGDCIGRPFMNAEDNLARPNLRRAMLYGRLTFTSTDYSNRDITFPFDAYFTCAAENGARDGDFLVDVNFSEPVIGEPGFWESILSFFSVGEWSRLMESEIEDRLSPASDQRSNEARCASVGIELGDRPTTDNVKFDAPASAARRAPRFRETAVGAIRETATVRLLSVTRKPLPVHVPSEHAHPGSVEAGQFSVFVNGVQKLIPPLGDTTPPPEGGQVPLNYCVTAELAGNDRLQVLFTNDLGGAVWSDFTRQDGFGSGAPRKMTTGRAVVLPADDLPDLDPPRLPPNLDGIRRIPVPSAPSSGVGSDKPQPFTLREFELLYEIKYNPTPRAVGAVRGPSVRGTKGVTAVRPGRDTAVLADPSTPPEIPCRPL